MSSSFGTVASRSTSQPVSRTLILQAATGSTNVGTSALTTTLTSAPITVQVTPMPTGTFLPYPDKVGPSSGTTTTTPAGWIDYPTGSAPAFNSYDIAQFPSLQSQRSTTGFGSGSNFTGRFVASFSGPITKVRVMWVTGNHTISVRIGLTHVNGIPQFGGTDATFIPQVLTGPSTTQIANPSGTLVAVNGSEISIPLAQQISPGVGVPFYVQVFTPTSTFFTVTTNDFGGSTGTYVIPGTLAFDSGRFLKMAIQFHNGSVPVTGTLLQTSTQATVNTTGVTQTIPAGTENDALRTLFGGVNFPGAIDAPPPGCRWIVKQ